MVEWVFAFLYRYSRQKCLIFNFNTTFKSYLKPTPQRLEIKCSIILLRVYFDVFTQMKEVETTSCIHLQKRAHV